VQGYQLFFVKKVLTFTWGGAVPTQLFRFLAAFLEGHAPYFHGSTYTSIEHLKLGNIALRQFLSFWKKNVFNNCLQLFY
jgi:hypothetical protein